MTYLHNLPKEMTERYADSEGNECPFCHSEDISTGDRKQMGTEVGCDNCKREWLECTRIIGVLLNKEYVKPMEELKHEAIRSAYAMLHLLLSVRSNTTAHKVSINRLFTMLIRADIDETMHVCNQYFTRLGGENEDYDSIYEIWEQAASHQRDLIVGSFTHEA